MSRLLSFLLVCLFSASSYAVTGYYSYYAPGVYSSQSAWCSAAISSKSCGNYAGTAILISNNGWDGSYCRVSYRYYNDVETAVRNTTCTPSSMSCPVSFNAKPANAGASCTTCQSPKVSNPYTLTCTDPCPSDGAVLSGFYDTSSSCSSGCAVSHHQISQLWGFTRETSYTGDFCSGDNMQPGQCPPNYVQVGNSCEMSCGNGAFPSNGQCICSDDSKEYYQDQCVKKCAAGEIRGELGQCLPNCEAGTALIGGACVPTSCPDGQELQQGRCVDHPTNPNCGEGEVSDANGMCVPACESGAMIGGQCADVECPDSQYLKNGKCVNRDNTLNCPSGMRPNSDGTKCVALECPSGQVVSYLLNKCVDDPNQKQCPAGTHKEGLLCVPDNKDCPINTHWEIGCKKCVRDGSPIGVCGGVAGDMDGDGTPDSSDNDLDGDGTPNSSDDDADGDGIPNSSDSDDDNDGIPDANDLTPRGPGTNNPDLKCVGPNCDTDGDGIPDGQDPDKDGNGIPDDQETERAGGVGGPLGDLYESKGLTLAKVWQDFSIRISQAPIVVASSSFFTLPYFSANCPVWTFPATAFSDPIVFNYFCDPAVTQALQLAGIIVLLIAAWVAFRIAIL